MNRITSIALAAACALATAITPAAAQNAIFAKYSSRQDVDYVCVSSAMLRLMGAAARDNIKVNGMDIKKLTGKLKKIVIIDAEQQDAVSQMQADYAVLASDESYEVLMETHSGDETSVTLLNTSAPTSEFVMYVRDGDDATFIVMTGTFTEEDIADIAGAK